MIKTKSVYSKIGPRNDGLRILATWGRGHGLPKSRYRVWIRSVLEGRV